MTNLTANTLVDLIERGNRIREDSAQFERDIWAIKAEGFRQLAETIGAAPSGSFASAVSQAADAYLAERRVNGILEEKVEALLTATTEDLACDHAGDEDFTTRVHELCQAIIEAGKAWRQAVSIFNRSGIFYYMPSREGFDVLQSVFDAWATSACITPPAIPESPYYKPTSVILRDHTFDGMKERGARIAADAAGFAEDISLIKAVASTADGTLDKLQTQSNELSKRCAKMGDMEKHPAYPGLSDIFQKWQKRTDK